MRKLLALSICAVALFGLMSCQNETTPIVDQLKYSDTPNWSGTTWQGIDDDETITRYVTTVNGSSSQTARTSIRLRETVYALSLNADRTFRFTISSVYGANWANDYIPDNWYYSTSSSVLTPPDLANSGIDYSEAFINGTFVSYGSLPSTEYTIGQESTTYNGQTVFPVTFSSTSAAALKAAALVGKAYNVDTTEGTYAIRALSTNPVDKSNVPYLTPTSQYERTFNDAGAVLTEQNHTNSIDPNDIYDFNSCFLFTNGIVTNPEGEQVYSILCRRNMGYEKSIQKMDVRVSSGLILYQQD